MQRPAQVPPVRPQFRLVGGTLTGQGRRDEVGEAPGCIDGRQCPTRDFPVIVSWRKVALMAAMTAALAACGGGGGGGGTPAPQSSNGNTGAISNGGGTVLARINACPNGGGGTGVAACVVGAYKGTDPVTKQECTVDITSDYRVTFRNPNHLYQFQEPETPFFYSKTTNSAAGIPIFLMTFRGTNEVPVFKIATGFENEGANITARYVDLTVEVGETDTTARYEGTCRVPA